MSEASIEPLLPHRVDFDGVELAFAHAAGAALEVWLDGQPYAQLRADAAGEARLALPFAPNGRARANLELCAGAQRSAAIGLRFGQSGLERAGTVEPLAPLRAQDYVDVVANAAALRREVAIVVPVYDAPAAVQACLDSVLAQTAGAARLIVIDDASPDPAIAPLLAQYRGCRGVTLLANDRNRGFTATANRGIEVAGRADVVLLNADTEVAAHWLTGLRRAAWAAPDTASATAVSDNAGAFSVPELEQRNPLPTGWHFAQAALALRQHAGSAYPRLPTGNGFCLYLKRAALDAVGVLDAEAFSQGYGEENDWCQRAAVAGWQHVIAGDVFVRHARSQSFGDARRAALGAAGMAVLRERWPQYEAEVGASLFSPRRRVLDWRVRRAYAAAPPLPRWLYFGDAPAPQRHAAAIYRCERGRDGWRVIDADGVGTTVETLADAGVVSAASERAWTASFAQLLQMHAIDRIVGPLPAALAQVANLLDVDTDTATAARAFGATA